MCPLCHVIYLSCEKGPWRQSLLLTARCCNVWQELDYRIDICCVTKGGYIEHLYGRTEIWSVSPSVDVPLSA
jgi:hypothetical protein